MKNKLILGTVQFGLDYGINNQVGKPSISEIYNILDEAKNQGISLLDTADAYGNAIDIIGEYHKNGSNPFKILSKFKNVKKGELVDSIKINLEKLDIDSFEVYSYHLFSDYHENPYLKDELQLAKQSGIIKKTGISVYSNDELEKAIYSEIIDVIQLPYNLLDNENIRGVLLKTAKKLKKEIHVRSVFLQGLFFKNLQTLPEKLGPLMPYLKQIEQICSGENVSIESLALSYPLFNQYIDNILIGVDTKEQLIKNINSIVSKPEFFDLINQRIMVKEIELLNPVNWK